MTQWPSACPGHVADRGGACPAPASVGLHVYCRPVAPDDDVDQALGLMRDRAVRRLPVVEEGRVVGVVSLGDVAIEREPGSALGDISAAWKERYKIRAGVEGTIFQAVGRSGLRRSRNSGLAKTSLQYQLTGAAINLARIDAHLTDTPRARTRTSHFAALCPAELTLDGAKPGPN